MPSRQPKDTPIRPGDRPPTTFSALSGLADDVVEVFAKQSVSKSTASRSAAGPKEIEPTIYTPSASWSRTAVPTEPPLGYSINDLEPTGTPMEVSASVAGSLVAASLGEVVALAKDIPAFVVETDLAQSPNPEEEKEP